MYNINQINGVINVYNKNGELQHTQDMHTLNENFLSIFAFRCYDENMIATLGINIRDSRNYGFIPSSYPSFGY